MSQHTQRNVTSAGNGIGTSAVVVGHSEQGLTGALCPGSMRDPRLGRRGPGGLFRGRHLAAGVMCCALVPALGALLSGLNGIAGGAGLPALGPASASASTGASSRSIDQASIGSLRGRAYQVTMHTTDGGIRYTVRQGNTTVAEALTLEQARPYLSGGEGTSGGPLMLATEREMP